MFFKSTHPVTNKSLCELAYLHRLDKGDYEVSMAEWHEKYPLHDTMGYTRTYDRVMKPFKNEAINFLEIGIADPRFPFGSCQMWRAFFTRAKLYAMDNFASFAMPAVSKLAEVVTHLGVNFFHGDQGNFECLQEIKFHVPDGFRFIIDDGSHLPGDILASFDALWPMIVPDGVYFIEDVGIGMDRFSHENAEILEWASTVPQRRGGVVEKIRATTGKYEAYLLAITKKVKDA